MFNKVNKILQNDGVIAFVTDTVWGMGCLPSSKTAVKKIYEIKKRDGAKPLILMSNEIYNLFDYIQQPIEKEAQILIKKHFPGALTLVLDKSDKTPNYLTSNMSTVGIRIPDNKTFADICANVDGHVLATTSANISGEAPALSYEEAINYLGNKVDMIIPSFGCEAEGHASTVASVQNAEIQIFRQGIVNII